MINKLIICIFSIMLFLSPVFSQDNIPNIDSLKQLYSTYPDSAKNAFNMAQYYRAYEVNLDSLEKYALRTIELSILEADQEKKAMSFYFLGFIRFQKHADFDGAIGYFKESKALYTKLDIPEAIHGKDSALASMYLILEDYEEAKKHFALSIDGARKFNDYNTLAVSYSNLGHIHMVMEQYDVMKRTYLEGLDFIEKDTSYKKQKVKIDLLLNLAEANLFLEDYPSADSTISVIQNELKAYPNYPFMDRVAIVKLNYYKYTNQEDKLIELSAETLPLLRKNGYSSSEYYTCLYYNSLGKKDSKLKEESIDEMILAMKGERPDNRKNLSYYIASLYDSMGKHQKALEYTQLHHIINDSLRQESATTEMQELRVLFDLEKNENKLKEVKIEQMKLTKSRNLLFMGLLLIAFIGLSYFLYNEMRRAKDKSRLQNLEQKMLSLQMNPHFIFNAISSVQNYLFDEGDRAFALKKLGVFSSLIRQMLEYNRKKFITWEQEQDFLENYLDIQKLRFNNSFDYTINIAEDLNPDDILIPPMLIQPLVENSIEHGKVYLEETGLISISISKTKKVLTIKVEDNGLGLQNTISKTKSDKESLAIDINRERLKLIYSKFKHIAKMEFANIQPSKGTSVLISLPIQN